MRAKFRTHIYHYRHRDYVYEGLALEVWDVDFWRTLAVKELT